MALIDNEEAARRLARVIVSDIELYNRDKIASGANLTAEIQEGYRLFRSRVMADLSGIFADTLATKDLGAGAVSAVTALGKSAPATPVRDPAADIVTPPPAADKPVSAADKRPFAASSQASATPAGPSPAASAADKPPSPAAPMKPPPLPVHAAVAAPGQVSKPSDPPEVARPSASPPVQAPAQMAVTRPVPIVPVSTPTPGPTVLAAAAAAPASTSSPSAPVGATSSPSLASPVVAEPPVVAVPDPAVPVAIAPELSVPAQTSFPTSDPPATQDAPQAKVDLDVAVPDLRPKLSKLRLVATVIVLAAVAAAIYWFNQP